MQLFFEANNSSKAGKKWEENFINFHKYSEMHRWMPQIIKYCDIFPFFGSECWYWQQPLLFRRKIASVVNEPRTTDYDFRVWNVVNHLDVSNRVGPLWNCDLRCIVCRKGYLIVSQSVNETQMSQRFLLDEVIECDWSFQSRFMMQKLLIGF